jgi:L-2-aminoadipate reductase
MPLNPNGKVDKPALPFPDTAQLTAGSRQNLRGEDGEIILSSTENLVREIWLSIIPHAPHDLRLNDNFFDIGGHSILATRVVFEIRKRFAVDISLGILFREPTISGLAREIDDLRSGALDVTSRPDSAPLVQSTSTYLLDAKDLLGNLPATYPSASPSAGGLDSLNIFLTGSTGFLGAFLIRDLLSRTAVNIRIVAHVRAASPAIAFQRLKSSCEAYGVWSEKWLFRLEVVTGSLEEDMLGIPREKWKELSQSIDIVIHNGAMVNVAPARVLTSRCTGCIPMCSYEVRMLPALCQLWASVTSANLSDSFLSPPLLFLTQNITSGYPIVFLHAEVLGYLNPMISKDPGRRCQRDTAKRNG